MTYDPLPIRDTPTLLPSSPFSSLMELLFPTLMAQHSGLSTYVPTSLYAGVSLLAFVFPRSATKPSVKPIATSMLLSLSDAVRAPVPVGKGLMSASRPKCLMAK